MKKQTHLHFGWIEGEDTFGWTIILIQFNTFFTAVSFWINHQCSSLSIRYPAMYPWQTKQASFVYIWMQSVSVSKKYQMLRSYFNSCPHPSIFYQIHSLSSISTFERKMPKRLDNMETRTWRIPSENRGVIWLLRLTLVCKLISLLYRDAGGRNGSVSSRAGMFIL